MSNLRILDTGLMLAGRNVAMTAALVDPAYDCSGMRIAACPESY